MWTAISVLTFLGWWWLLRRLQLRSGAWKSERADAGGIPYLFAAPRHKGKVVGVLLGIEGAWGWSFTLRPERWYDRFAKRLGLGVECQTGDGAFDAAWFVVADAPGTMRAIARSAAFRATVLRVAGLCAERGARIAGLHFDPRRVWVNLAPAAKGAELAVDGLAVEIVPALREAAEQLAREGVTGGGEPAAARAALLHSCAAALLVNGVIHALRLIFDDTAMDEGRLLFLALLLGAGIAALLALLTLVLLAGSSRRHTKLAAALFVGFAGGLLNGFVLLRDVNREFDRGEERRIVVAVQGKRERRRRRRGMVRELFVEDWRRERARRTLEVSKRGYDAATGRVVVHERPGLLGAWWVEKVGILVPRPAGAGGAGATPASGN